MGNIIVKAAKDLDLYVEWSSIVEAPLTWGTRQEFLDEGYAEERLERADARGSSSYIGICFWGDDDGLILEQRGFLPRAKIPAYLEIMTEQWKAKNFDGDDPRILALLEPLE
jgi:hypothetical protein